MKAVKTGTVKSKIKRGDQVVVLSDFRSIDLAAEENAAAGGLIEPREQTEQLLRQACDFASAVGVEKQAGRSLYGPLRGEGSAASMIVPTVPAKNEPRPEYTAWPKLSMPPWPSSTL